MDKTSYNIGTFLTAVLVRSEEKVEVEFHSDIHTNKVSTMTVSYSSDFTDEEILKDRDFLKNVARYK